VADPWTHQDQAKVFTNLDVSRMEKGELKATHLEVKLHAPADKMAFKYEDAFDANSIAFPESDFSLLHSYTAKFLDWYHQIQTEKLNVPSKVIGETTGELTFYGTHFLQQTSSSCMAYVHHVNVVFFLQTRGDKVYFVWDVSGAAGASDPADAFPSQSYYWTPDQAQPLLDLFAPESHELFKRFFAGTLTSTSVVPPPAPAPNDAAKLK
jgi:hypothetical protein